MRLLLEVDAISGPPLETHFFDFALPLLAAHRGPYYPRDDVARVMDAYARSYWLDGSGIDPRGLLDALTPGSAVWLPYVFRKLVESLASGDALALVEKTPQHLWSWPVAALDNSVKFVLFVRDPRAVVESTVRVGWEDSLEAALRWREAQREIVRVQKALTPAHARLFRYEDVVSDPQSFRVAVCEFLGLEREHAACRHVIRSHDLFLGREEPVKQQALGAIDASRLSQWRTHLADDETADIEAVCGPLMEAFGYQRASKRSAKPDVSRIRTALRVHAEVARIRRDALRASGDHHRLLSTMLALQYKGPKGYWDSFRYRMSRLRSMKPGAVT